MTISKFYINLEIINSGQASVLNAYVCMWKSCLSFSITVTGSSTQLLTLERFVPFELSKCVIFAWVWHDHQECQVESRYCTRYLYTSNCVVRGSTESGGSVYILSHPKENLSVWLDEQHSSLLWLDWLGLYWLSLDTYIYYFQNLDVWILNRILPLVTASCSYLANHYIIISSGYVAY